MTQGSIWGELDPETTERIKGDIRRAVSEGIAAAVEDGSIQHAISHGLTDGLRRASSDEELIDALMARIATSFRRSATEASGRIVVDGVVGMAKRAGWIMLVSLLIYSIGGPAALVTFWKYLTAGQTTS